MAGSKWVHENLRTKTYEYYDLQVRRHIPAELKAKRLSDVDKATAISTLNLITSGARSQVAKRKAFVTVRTAFQYFTDQGMLTANPFILPRAIIPRAPRGTSNDKALTCDQECTFLRLVSGHEFEALFVLALDSGARQGEIWALTWGDVDLDLNLLTLDKSLGEDKKGRLTVGPPKGECRTIEISPVTVNLLKRLRCGRSSEPVSRLIFADRTGGPLRKSNFNRRIFAPIFAGEEALKAGLKKFHFHRLRHTCATRLLEEGEYLVTVQKRLGHRDVRTTLLFYAHAVPGGQQSAANRFTERIKSYST
jgi:integrase